MGPEMAAGGPEMGIPEAGMGPEMGGMGEEALSEDDILAQLQAMGGSPMPGAQDGGIL
jgi:hypothetical protein